MAVCCLQYGLLAGGLADGSVCLWDPAAILDKSKGNPILAKMQKHTGAVKGLEFNSYSPNLLASGAADSDLCIWDLAQPSKPSLYPALKVRSGQQLQSPAHRMLPNTAEDVSATLRAAAPCCYG
jgi:protein transport protein SEC31